MTGIIFLGSLVAFLFQSFLFATGQEARQVVVPEVVSSTPSLLGEFVPEAAGYRKSSTGRSIATGIVVDTDSYDPSASELQEFVRLVNNILVARTDTEIQLLGVQRLSYGVFGENWVYEAYKNMPDPEFVIFLKADSISMRSGGYSASYESREPGFASRFKNKDDQRNQIVVSVSAWKHQFGMCGYDSTGKHISSVALPGQCRNRSGVQCILQNEYYQCSDEEMLTSFYGRNVYGFSAGIAVHELMHQFGRNGNLDHYGSGECAGLGATDLHASQEYVGICPYVFDRFVQSYF